MGLVPPPERTDQAARIEIADLALEASKLKGNVKYRVTWKEDGKRKTSSNWDSPIAAESFKQDLIGDNMADNDQVTITPYRKFVNNSGKPRYGSGKHRGA